jgi:hypothetical protein
MISLGSFGWILSYITANFALIAVVVLAVVALGAVAWFAKNWKVAIAALGVLAAGFAYQQIDKNAYQRRVSEEAAQQVNALQAKVNALSEINHAAAVLAVEAQKKADDLHAAANNTPANSAPCFDLNASKRVGGIR